MKVFEHPVDKKTRDDLAKLSIYEILRSRNESEKQRRIKIFEILARRKDLLILHQIIYRKIYFHILGRFLLYFQL